MMLSDDSGLEVEALGDPPGVCSARFAGPEAGDEENNRLLLKMLAGRPARERRARFRCVMSIAVPGEIYLARGSCPVALPGTLAAAEVSVSIQYSLMNRQG
ncbi:MAG: hypothetical protein GX883_06075 [Firmicutes bacterium]|nr:hypothetical protein [Bacillota bacterium]